MTSPNSGFSTRNLLQLNVGQTHTISVLIYLRTCDLDWWNQAHSKHLKSLIRLISTQILPLECREEIESFHERENSRMIGRGGNTKNVVNNTSAKMDSSSTSAYSYSLSDRNKKSEGNAKAKNTAIVKKKRKRSNAGGKEPKRKIIKKSNDQPQQQTLAFGQKSTAKSGRHAHLEKGSKGETKKSKSGKESTSNHPTTKDAVKKSKSRQYTESLDMKYLFHNDIQVTYKIEPISTVHSATLTFRRDNHVNINENDKTKNRTRQKQTSKQMGLSTFRKLRKLPKQIVLWCFPFDPTDPHKDSTVKGEGGEYEGGGFPRPEMIPLSLLFSEK